MRVGMAADQHEGHAARGQLRQQRIGAGVRAAVRVAQDQAVHAPRHRHVDQLALLVRLVLGVGDEGQVAVFGGGFVHAFVDRGQHHVGQARHQHADAAAAAGLEAGGVRIGLVAQLGRQRADTLDGAAAAPRASSSEPFRTRGHRRHVQAELPRQALQRDGTGFVHGAGGYTLARAMRAAGAAWSLRRPAAEIHLGFSRCRFPPKTTSIPQPKRLGKSTGPIAMTTETQNSRFRYRIFTMVVLLALINYIDRGAMSPRRRPHYRRVRAGPGRLGLGAGLFRLRLHGGRAVRRHAGRPLWPAQGLDRPATWSVFEIATAWAGDFGLAFLGGSALAGFATIRILFGAAGPAYSIINKTIATHAASAASWSASACSARRWARC